MKKILLITIASITAFLIYWLIPESYIYKYFIFGNDYEKVNALKEIRSSILNIFGGILAIIGLWFTYRRTEALDYKNKIDEAKLL